MARNGSNSFFEKFLDESLRRLSKSLEKEIANSIASIFAPHGKEKKGGGSIFDGGSSVDGILNVIIHNNAPVSVGAQEKTDAFGQKQLEITIDQMVANALVRGRQTSGVLGSLFNIVPGLSGR